jgi:hypothetical protein
MAESEAPSRGRIFISYRWQETAYPGGWLCDRLADEHASQVFNYLDTIELVDDLLDAITSAVASSVVLPALTGDQLGHDRPPKSLDSQARV